MILEHREALGQKWLSALTAGSKPRRGEKGMDEILARWPVRREPKQPFAQ